MGIAVAKPKQHPVAAPIVEAFLTGQQQLADPVQRIILAAAVRQRLVLDPAPYLIEAAVADVGSDRGAVSASRRIRFPGPSPEPDVREHAQEEPVHADLDRRPAD